MLTKGKATAMNQAERDMVDEGQRERERWAKQRESSMGTGREGGERRVRRSGEGHGLKQTEEKNKQRKEEIKNGPENSNKLDRQGLLMKKKEAATGWHKWPDHVLIIGITNSAFN